MCAWLGPKPDGHGRAAKKGGKELHSFFLSVWREREREREKERKRERKKEKRKREWRVGVKATV